MSIWVDLTRGSAFKIVRALIAGRGRESEIGFHLGQYHMKRRSDQQRELRKRHTV